MTFLISSLQPAADAAGTAFRMRLPAAGRVALSFPELRSGRMLPAGPTTAAGQQLPRTGPAPCQRAQHRAQCRANCMNKANF